MLLVKNLHVWVADKKILNGVSVTVKPGEIHAIMGPNGSGKSTLAYSLMGHPSYEIRNPNIEIRNLPRRQAGKSKIQKSKCQMMLDGKDLLNLKTDERAKLGLFLAFQSPIAVPGVTVAKFLRHISKTKIQRSKDPKIQNKTQDLKDAIEVNKKIDILAEKLSIKPELLKRSFNEGFSGGERKKIETLQMLFLKPKYAIMDEVDTGLDVDALKVVAKGIKEIVKKNTGVVIITHYNRILKHVKPTKVHVMLDGKIVKTGDAELAREVEKEGYTQYKF